MKSYTVVILLLASTMLTAFLVSCKSEQEIIGEERQSVLVYADPITDGILEGHNQSDYPKYSRDFDETMKNALTETVFKQKHELIFSKIGKYKSRKLGKVVKQSGYIVALYLGEFEKESGVIIRVVFQKYGEKNLVAGLWFNSPKLRE